jgi:IS30 family transposase
MGHKEPYTFELREKIEELVKKGYSFSSIARETNRSMTGISYEIARAGGRQNYTAKGAQAAAEKMEKNRISKYGRKKEFSNAIFELINKGYSLNEVSGNLGISKNYICKVMRDKDKLFSKERALAQQSNVNSFDTRIAALEMQIEIIHQQLEILNDSSTKN